MVAGCERDHRPLRLARPRRCGRGQGLHHLLCHPVRNYRDFLAIDDRYSHCHWLFQHNGGVFLPPWGKAEQWLLSRLSTRAEDADRFIDQLRALRGSLARMTASGGEVRLVDLVKRFETSPPSTVSTWRSVPGEFYLPARALRAAARRPPCG